jgi:hypothetical protein
MIELIEPESLSACPQCDCTRIVTRNESVHLPYGVYPDDALIVYVTPVRHCLKCGLSFTDDADERAQEMALTRYRRALRLDAGAGIEPTRSGI